MSKRPPVKPKPIGRHPHAGQYAVVVSFRFKPQSDNVTADSIRRDILDIYTEEIGLDVADLDVAVRVLGAAGEASEHEIWPPHGPLAVTIDVVDPLALTEDDIQTIRTTRDQDTIDPKGRL